ncbi:MAG: 30S ribosomal protein S8 [Patescibacteria group bacterium]
MHTDPISDLLTQIRNALAAQKDAIRLPYSNIKKAICDILVKNKYIGGVSVEEEGVHRYLCIDLTGENPPLELKRMSKPGQRRYVAAPDIRSVRKGLGCGIYSSSQGILTDYDMRKRKIGGEYLCEIF